jgi:hypothetical protein
MTKPPAPPHLRLVAQRERGWPATSKLNSPEGTQLSFAYPETSAVVFVLIAAIGRDEFARIIDEYLPRWIFDVRTVPRLDTIAQSRHSAFTLFERNKTSYIDLFGRLSINSYKSADSNPVFWGKEVFKLLKEADVKGPYLFLFDNERLLHAANKVLPSVIMPLIGKSASIARIGM